MGALRTGGCREGYRHPPGSEGRGHRVQPAVPGRALLRQRHHGHPADRGRPAGRRGEVRGPRDGLRLPEVHPGPVPRGRSLERVSRGDERPLRPREEDAPRPGAGVPPAVRVQCHIPPAGQPVWAGGHVRPCTFPRDPGTHPKVCRGGAGGETRGRGLGDRECITRVPVCRGRGPCCPAGDRTVQQTGPGEHWCRTGDLDSGSREPYPEVYRV